MEETKYFYVNQILYFLKDQKYRNKIKTKFENIKNAFLTEEQVRKNIFVFKHIFIVLF